MSEKYGIDTATALVNDSSGFIPVGLLNTGTDTKLYRGKTLGRVSNTIDSLQF
jgi:hypothetical protein